VFLWVVKDILVGWGWLVMLVVVGFGYGHGLKRTEKLLDSHENGVREVGISLMDLEHSPHGLA